MADGTRSKGSLEEHIKQQAKIIEDVQGYGKAIDDVKASLDAVQKENQAIHRENQAIQRENAKRFMGLEQKFETISQQLALLIGDRGKATTSKESEPPLLATPRFEAETHDATFSTGHGMGINTTKRESLPIVPKIDLPTFDGEGPREWVRKCEEYFVINDVEPIHQLRIAVIYLRGAADRWYGSWRLRFPWASWTEFSQALCARFSSRILSDMVGEFRDLKQTGTVEEYQRKFDELMIYMVQQNPELTEKFYVDCFVGGLSEELRGLVGVSEPQTLEKALLFAQAHENMVKHLAAKTKSEFRTLNYHGATVGSKYSPFPKAVEMTKEPATAPQMMISPSQLQEKRNKGLCYRCDERYTPSHKCKNQHLHFMLADDAEVYREILQDDPSLARISVEESMESSQLSFSSMSCQLNASTIRVQGMLKRTPINILIDSGSSHSFIDISIAKKLDCIVEATKPMIVTIVDGSRIVCDLMCPNLPWTVQDHRFRHDVRLIKLGGCDMVLGVDWMKKHGPISLDFERLQMSFKRDGEEIVLQGNTDSAQLKLISCSSFKKHVKRGACGLFGFINRIKATEFELPQALPHPSYTLPSKSNMVYESGVTRKHIQIFEDFKPSQSWKSIYSDNKDVDNGFTEAHLIGKDSGVKQNMGDCGLTILHFGLDMLWPMEVEWYLGSKSYDGVNVKFLVFIWDPGIKITLSYILEDKNVVERVGLDIIPMGITLLIRGFNH